MPPKPIKTSGLKRGGKPDPAPSPRMEDAGIATWANDDGSEILQRYDKIKKDVRNLREIAHKGHGGPNELLGATDIGMALLLDLQEIGYAFSLTLEGEKTAILQLELANLQIAELIRRVNIVKTQRDDAIERIGGKNQEEINKLLQISPRNDRETEQTIDQFISKATKHMSQVEKLPQIAGLDQHVVKMGSNQYKIAGQVVYLDIQDKQVFVRVGGGFMEFSQWMKKNQSRIQRYIAGAEGEDEEDDELGKMNDGRKPSMERRASNGAVSAVLRSNTKDRGAKGDEDSKELAKALGRSSTMSRAPRKSSSAVMKEKFQESQHEAKKVGTAMDAEKERQQQKLAQQLARKKAANRDLEDEVKVSRMREESHQANQALRDVNIALDKARDDLAEEKRQREAIHSKLVVLQKSHASTLSNMYQHACSADATVESITDLISAMLNKVGITSD